MRFNFRLKQGRRRGCSYASFGSGFDFNCRSQRLKNLFTSCTLTSGVSRYSDTAAGVAELKKSKCWTFSTKIGGKVELPPHGHTAGVEYYLQVYCRAELYPPFSSYTTVVHASATSRRFIKKSHCLCRRLDVDVWSASGRQRLCIQFCGKFFGVES